jgi:hypothetical protein
MKYKPRHVVLNLISAAVMVMAGMILLLKGLSDINTPVFEWDAWGLHSNVMYEVVFGALSIMIGGVGVYHLAKYLKDKQTKAKTKK